MKIIRTLRTLIPLAILSAFVFSAKAQIYVQYTLLTPGTNYAQILLNFQTQSNTAFIPYTAHSIQVTNIFTNETITLIYGYQPTGQTATNVNSLGVITTNFSAATGYTAFPTNWTYTIAGVNYFAPVTPWAGFGISSNSAGNLVTAPNSCSNGVSFY